MKLQEIFDALSSGELSQLNVGISADGKVADKDYNTLLTNLNLGLTALHTRFVLKLQQIELILLEGRTRYHLHSDHRFSDEALAIGDFRLDVGFGTLLTDVQTNPDPEYIRDQPYAKFVDDLLKVEEVHTTAGFELNLNVRSDPWSIMTPKDTLLVVPPAIVAQSPDLPDRLKTDRLIVTYRANHPKLQPGAGEYDGNRGDIDLPYTHLQALLYFVASRIHNPVGMGQEFNSGNNWYAKYLAECQELEGRGMYVDTVDQPDRLRRNGWV